MLRKHAHVVSGAAFQLTMGRRALSAGQGKSTVWFKPLWVEQGGQRRDINLAEVDFFVLLAWGGSNKTVHPTSPKPPGRVHTSRLVDVKAIPAHLNPTIRANNGRETERGERRGGPGRTRGGGGKNRKFSTVWIEWTPRADFLRRRKKTTKVPFSPNLFGLNPHRQTLNSRWRKSMFVKGGKAVCT